MPSYEDRLVAFLDILGFKQAVLADTPAAEKTIAHIDKVLRHGIDVVTNLSNAKFTVRLFSDCLCLSCGLSDLYDFMREVAFLQYHLASGGLWLRGGLAVGRHFENELMVFSQGLVDAYLLEGRAVYPRVLIADSIIRMIAEEEAPGAKSALQRLVMLAPDGEPFLDYLEWFREELDDHVFGSGEVEDFLTSHKAALEAAVANHHDEARVIEKFRWLVGYHNHKVSELFDADLEDEIHASLISEAIFPSFRSSTSDSEPERQQW
jgi:hypothetical protein